MIERHLTVPHRFICFTDRPDGINPNIEIRLLPTIRELSGWWWKPYIFKDDHFPSGDTNLFLDLDMVIVRNIDNLITYMPGQFLGLRDVGRVWNRGVDKLGSAVLRWQAGTYGNIWTDLVTNTAQTKKMTGDQDWIWHLHKNSVKFFPDKWIISYKWEARTKDELVRINNRLNFKNVRNVELDPTTSVLAFHGTPDPHEVTDPIIVDNWR